MEASSSSSPAGPSWTGAISTAETTPGTVATSQRSSQRKSSSGRGLLSRLSRASAAAKSHAEAAADGGLDLSAVRADIARSLHDPTHDDGSLAPLMIRFTWHSCGTYDHTSKTGGSDGGTIWLPAEAGDIENAGFDKARRLVMALRARHPTLSLADLTVLCGCVAIEATGGPRVPFASGRRDFSESEAVAKNGNPAFGGCPYGDGTFNPSGSRLPPADLGLATGCPVTASRAEKESPTINAVRGTFRRLGMSDRETVALIVLGHQYGRCHPQVSGYEHPWYAFDPAHWNVYDHGLGFMSAFHMGHREEANSTGKRQFNARMGFGGGLEPFMMLPSDMALVADPAYSAILSAYDDDRLAFKRDAALAFKRLTELGCPEGLLKPELASS